jgi:hypothetical protein
VALGTEERILITYIYHILSYFVGQSGQFLDVSRKPGLWLVPEHRVSSSDSPTGPWSQANEQHEQLRNDFGRVLRWLQCWQCTLAKLAKDNVQDWSKRPAWSWLWRCTWSSSNSGSGPTASGLHWLMTVGTHHSYGPRLFVYGFYMFLTCLCVRFVTLFFSHCHGAMVERNRTTCYILCILLPHLHMPWLCCSCRTSSLYLAYAICNINAMQAKDDWSFASVTGHDCHNSCIAKIRSCGLPMLVLYGFAMFYVAFYSFTMFSSSPLRCSVRQVNSINKAVVATKTAADTMVLSSTGRLKQQALQEVSKQKGRRSRTGSSFLCSSLTDVQTIQIWLAQSQPSQPSRCPEWYSIRCIRCYVVVACCTRLGGFTHSELRVAKEAWALGSVSTLSSELAQAVNILTCYVIWDIWVYLHFVIWDCYV